MLKLVENIEFQIIVLENRLINKKKINKKQRLL